MTADRWRSWTDRPGQLAPRSDRFVSSVVILAQHRSRLAYQLTVIGDVTTTARELAPDMD